MDFSLDFSKKKLSSLLIWVNSFQTDRKIDNLSQLSDGVELAQYLKLLGFRPDDSISLSPLEFVVSKLSEFYGCDLTKYGAFRLSEFQGGEEEEIAKVLVLLLCMAVQSDNKPFIEAILYFPEDVQYDLKYFIEATLEQMANGVLCSGDIILSRSLQPPKGTSIFNQVAHVCIRGTDISSQPFGGSNNNDSFDVDPEVNKGMKKFYTKNSGVLYENDVIQIGVKSEYKETLGRVGIFYGNKTNFPLINFNAVIKLEDSLAKSMNLQPKPIPSTIDAGAQAQQLVNIECLAPFTSKPTIAITFTYNGAPKKLGLKLPVFITKFLQGTSMNSRDFFKRWKQLGNEPSQKAEKIFAARFPYNPKAIKDTIKSAGMEIMEGIDPNPDNYVAGAILSTSTVLVGCLLRLEPNKRTEMFRLTVRSSNPTVSKQLVDMLSTEF